MLLPDASASRVKIGKKNKNSNKNNKITTRYRRRSSPGS
jgi:hypothetical protein